MEEFLKKYAENLGHSLKMIYSISDFTKNSEIIGQYTEKMVVDFIRNTIAPLNICTGGILIKDKFNVDDDFIPQLDVILYEPNPLPPIFQVYDFGLVPKESVFGVLEIKRTDYSNGLKHIEDLYDWKFNNLPSYRDNNGAFIMRILWVLYV